MVIIQILAVVLAFCFLILTHEFGHFIMAKLCGVYVYSFNFGMGPVLLRWKGKETEYALKLFPIGGSTMMMGEDEESSDPRSFNQKSVLKRMSIIFGGPLMNFISAAALFIIMFTFIGYPIGTDIAVLPIEGKAAEMAGIIAGDRIIRINGEEILTVDDVSLAINNAAGMPILITLNRDRVEMEMEITPYFDVEENKWMIGVQSQEVDSYDLEKQNVFNAIWLGIKGTYIFTKRMIVAIVGMIAGTVPADIGGPVMIVTVIGQAAQKGLMDLLWLAAILSINLAVINLLPLPALDGGRLVFLAAEGIRGKPFNREREGMIHFIGLMLLFGLIIFVTYKDIIRLITKT